MEFAEKTIKESAPLAYAAANLVLTHPEMVMSLVPLLIPTSGRGALKDNQRVSGNSCIW